MGRTETTRIKLRRAGCILALAIVAVACASISGAAQEKKDSGGAPPKAGPAPRSADGDPDLSGVWFPDMRQYAPQAVAAVAEGALPAVGSSQDQGYVSSRS